MFNVYDIDGCLSCAHLTLEKSLIYTLKDINRPRYNHRIRNSHDVNPETGIVSEAGRKPTGTSAIGFWKYF